jgi:hypothetical protein
LENWGLFAGFFWADCKPIKIAYGYFCRRLDMEWSQVFLSRLWN